MAGICLPKPVVDKIQSNLKTGDLNVAKLAQMTSVERRKYLSKLVGEGNATFVNKEFETKLLLKNQKRGFDTWVRNLTNVKPEVKRDLISRIAKMDTLLSPADSKLFLKDLVEYKLGFSVKASETAKIIKMSRKVQELQGKQKPDGTFPTEKDRMAYGYAKVDMGQYLSDVKNAAEKKKFTDYSRSTDDALLGVEKASGVAKSLRASIDNSSVLRQGWKTAMTNPVLWGKNMSKTIGYGMKTLQGKDVMREVQADIVSRPNYDRMLKAKLEVGRGPGEDFPSSLPERIPIAGRFYKSSEVMYNGFLEKTRADLFDKYLDQAKSNGVDIDDTKELIAAGKLLNSMTGRGPTADGKAGRALNILMFSPRFVTANINTLTAHRLQGGMTPYARKQAMKNLVRIVAGTGGMLVLADTLVPGSVTEWDPRSSDFGKIKIGNTRFDLTGGQGSLIVLAAQEITQSQKSTTTGVVKKMGEGYGSKNGMDVLWNFLENKASPLAGVARDVIQQETFDGSKPTVANEATSLTMPIIVDTVMETRKDPNAANTGLVVLADFFGIGANTYGQTDRKTDKLSKANEQFKAKIGTEKFEEANTKFEDRYDTWLQENRSEYDKLPNEEKQTTLTAAKAKIQKKIYEEYNFKPETKKKSAEEKARKDSLLDKIR